MKIGLQGRRLFAVGCVALLLAMKVTAASEVDGEIY